MDNYVGKRIDGRYEIHEIIGVGGMAVVYKAYDSIDDRIVAVKVLKDEYLANEEFRRRFKNESKAIAVLSHPNIVKVYDVSFGDMLQYIVMEYIEGITVKEYIEQQHVINPKTAVHFVTQILRALQHAHDKGIIHRDIKPQNVMLLQNGNIKVTDFGIASFSRSDTKTMTDKAIGSVHYISPEQARGDVTGAEADIYSVGVVLYEMLTGKLPFMGDSAVSVALMQLQDEPTPPREINGSIPIGLEQITMRAMRKNPKDRYQSAAEMLLDLEEFKRNPAIKFDYTYFVDNEPTKYVGKEITETIKGAPKQTEPAPVQEGEHPYEPEEHGNGKLIPILTGVLVGLVAVALLIMAYLFFFTDTFNGNKVVVPNFSGLDYETEVLNNSEYKDFVFTTLEEFSSQFEFGEVLKQDPPKGSKVEKGSTVTLTINSNGKSLTVIDVYGQTYLAAKSTLEAAGFKTTYELVYDTTVAEGSVISTVPARNEKATENSVVTIYVATLEDANSVEVPELLTYDLETAKLLCSSVNLVLDENVTFEDSTEKQGTVLSQSPEPGEKVPPQSTVTVVVSSGKAASSTASLSVTLPYDAEKEGTLKVYLNNASYDAANATVLLNGNSYKFDVSGSGENVPLIVRVNGADIYSCNIDFTKTPAVTSNVKDFEYYATAYYGTGTSTIPDVTGKGKDDAIAVLKDKGFNNITVDYETRFGDDEIGTVLRQSPGSSILRRYTLDTQITLTVGKSYLQPTPSN